MSENSDQIRSQSSAEEALRLSEEKYRSLFESIDEGLCIVEVLFDQQNTPVDYRFLETNAAFERHTGLVQAQGKTARELLPDLENHWIEIYGNIALTGEPYRFENASEVMNRWFDVFAFRFGLAEQRKVAIRFKDISERKAAEGERERLLEREQAARAEAERANRIKDEFLAVLSHELRTPLNPILGWAKILQTQELTPSEVTEALKTITRNATLQAQLIDDLLDVSRILRGKLTLNIAPISLTTPILAAIETVRLAANAKAIQISTDLVPGAHYVSGDGVRLQQVIWNLLSNAVKFTPVGGQITVHLSQVDHLANLQVRDTGKGIKSDFLPYLFDHFRQEDNSITRKFGGLGLGLAISRQIVELHGGSIFAASKGENQGATFSIHLPLIKPETLPELQPFFTANNSPALSLAGLKIIVVDDSADSLEFIAFLLQKEGADVLTVSNAQKALQTIAEGQFDVLVSDIGMPEMDGYELIHQVRTLSQGNQIVALALTAFAQTEDRVRVLQAGYQAHITKPIEPTEFMATLIQLLPQEREA
jgi:PAS domain S-box-containing protein